MLYNFAASLIFAGEATRAIALLRPALVRSSGNGGLYLLLGAALFSMDRLSEARIALERGGELIPAGPQYHGTLACVLAAMGDTDGARQVLRELVARAEGGDGSAFEVACAYHWLGDDDAAHAWLERAFQSRTLWMTVLHLEPRLRRMRGTPRFDALVQRVGIAPIGEGGR